MKESFLRDLIAQKIHQLKPGLTLLQKEQYIPSEYGTKSFIDLYAADEEKRHVLIELKRSDVAARQAIHEVNKYVECVKQYFGAKDCEVHVIIASTEWGELLRPFSRFYVDAGFSIEGIQIDVAEGEDDFQAHPVLPLPPVQGRFIAPWHNVYWYASSSSFQQGINAIEAAYQKKGIDDYVIVRFCRAESAEKDNGEKSNNSFRVDEYIAYTAVQTLSIDKCLEILSRDKDLLEEAQEFLDDMSEEDALCQLHRYVEMANPSPKCDYYEIGYPAKFNHFFDHEDYTLLGIIRRGVFSRNVVLSDDTLYSELCGKDGLTGQKFKGIIRMDTSAHVKSLKENITTVLQNNPVWQAHILRIIREIESEFPNSEIDIWIFNPGTGIFTIYYALTKDQGFLYIPTYHIIVKNPEVVRLYFGALGTGGSAISFPHLLTKYYYGTLDALLYSATWGGRDERDSDIVEDLGARYRSYWANISKGEATEFFTLQEDKWRDCEPTSPLELLDEYVKKNHILVGQIVSKILPYDMNASFDGRNADAALEE